MKSFDMAGGERPANIVVPPALEELRAVEVNPGQQYWDAARQALHENADIVPFGAYYQADLGDLISEHISAPPEDAERVRTSVRKLAVEQADLLQPLSYWRYMVLPADEHQVERVRGIIAAVDTLADYVMSQGAGQVSFEDCYAIAGQQGLLPDAPDDVRLFARLFEAHRNVVPDEDGVAAKDIIPARSLALPATVGESLDMIYDQLQEADIFSLDRLLRRAGCVALSAFEEDQQESLVKAMKLDPRMGYLGNTGQYDVFIPHKPETEGYEDVSALATAAKRVGDLLVMRGLQTDIPDQLQDILAPGEGIWIAQRERLLGTELSERQKQQFALALPAHPALVNRPFRFAGKQTPGIRLTPNAQDYRENTLFPDIPARRQNELLEVARGITIPEDASPHRFVKSILRIQFGLKKSEYDFLRECIMPQVFGWERMTSNTLKRVLTTKKIRAAQATTTSTLEQRPFRI